MSILRKYLIPQYRRIRLSMLVCVKQRSLACLSNTKRFEQAYIFDKCEEIVSEYKSIICGSAAGKRKNCVFGENGI